MGNRKKILLISASYPFGKQESFLENEVKYLSLFFDIEIFPTYYNSDNVPREVPSNVTYHKPFIPVNGIRKALKVFFNFRFIHLEIRELFYMYQNSKLSLSNIKEYLVAVRALRCFLNSSFFKKLQSENKESVIYFYWANSLILSSIKFNLKTFARVHGAEFNLQRFNGYVPFVYQKSKMDITFLPISNDATDKLIYFNRNAKYEISRLGTTGRTRLPILKKESIIRVVSCSSMIPLKRIHLIIDALSFCTHKIQWIHFGDGELKDQIEKLAKDKLPQNVEYRFPGRVNNWKVLEFYERNYIDLFINVSNTEGVPVSVMEAMSFGIPCFATDVGGVSEIVNEFNGKLVDVDFNVSQLTFFIQTIRDESKIYLRSNAFKTWEDNYKSDKNFLKLKNIFLRRD